MKYCKKKKISFNTSFTKIQHCFTIEHSIFLCIKKIINTFSKIKDNKIMFLKITSK